MKRHASLLLLAFGFLVKASVPAFAAHTPAPQFVTVAGSLQ